MKRIFAALIAITIGYFAHAQCDGGRYWDEIFPSVTVDSVQYSGAYNQWMDIYQPAGDTASLRPLIILAHGGSFISGNGDRKTDPTVDSLCLRYAMRGYVTVSIDYRTTDIFSMFDSSLATDEVIKAISDGKAAIRFFMNDRATTNTYRIDTNNIYAGGNSAGAVLYMHAGYIDSIGECTASIAAAMAANGGLEGNSGYPGYTTRFNAIINLAGALNETSFIGPGDKPSVNAQGNNDMIVPYYCGHPLNGSVPVNLCGLGALEPVYVANSIYHMSHVFPGDGHVPWSNNVAKLFTVDSMVRVFLYNFVCTGANAVHPVASAPDVRLFPNPTSDIVRVEAPVNINALTVYDQTGRVVTKMDGLHTTTMQVDMARFAPGLYYMKLLFGAELPPVVRTVVRE